MADKKIKILTAKRTAKDKAEKVVKLVRKNDKRSSHSASNVSSEQKPPPKPKKKK
jgi:hypothetical protein